MAAHPVNGETHREKQRPQPAPDARAGAQAATSLVPPLGRGALWDPRWVSACVSPCPRLDRGLSPPPYTRPMVSFMRRHSTLVLQGRVPTFSGNPGSGAGLLFRLDGALISATSLPSSATVGTTRPPLPNTWLLLPEMQATTAPTRGAVTTRKDQTCRCTGRAAVFHSPDTKGPGPRQSEATGTQP